MEEHQVDETDEMRGIIDEIDEMVVVRLLDEIEGHDIIVSEVIDEVHNIDLEVSDEIVIGDVDEIDETDDDETTIIIDETDDTDIYYDEIDELLGHNMQERIGLDEGEVIVGYNDETDDVVVEVRLYDEEDEIVRCECIELFLCDVMLYLVV